MTLRDEIAVPGWAEQVRALPLPGGRLAIASDGVVRQIVSMD